MEKVRQTSGVQKLLSEYRPAVWRKSLLEAVPGIGKRALEVCTEQMRFTRELALTLRGNKLLGEKLYWIIYATYLSGRQPADVDEIMGYIAGKYKHVPRRTYFRLKRKAIQMLEACLDTMTDKNLQANFK